MVEYELNLRDYIRIFVKRIVVIILTFLVVTTISYLQVVNQPKIYTSKAIIKIEERKTIAGLLTEWIVYNPGDVMASSVSLIKSSQVLKKVALRLDLIEENVSPEEVYETVAMLQGNLEVEPMKNTNMIEITASSEVPIRARDIANAVAEVFVEENLAEKSKQERAARKFIQEQLSYIEERLRTAEERLRSLSLNGETVAVSPILQNKIAELELELMALTQSYTDKHPRIQQVRKQIETLQKQMDGEGGADAEGKSHEELERFRAARDVEVNKKLYIMLNEKLEESRINEAQKISDVSIVDPAVRPSAPKDTRKKVTVIFGAIIGLVMGMTFALVWESLDTSMATIEDVEGVVKLAVLGVVPSFDREFNKEGNFFRKLQQRFLPIKRNEEEERLVRMITHFKPHSSIAEAYRNIYTNLKIDAQNKTVLVTSSSPNEGKTSVVCNLGIVMGQLGLKTLLVASDLRRPTIHRTFGLKREPGLTELFIHTATLDEVINNATDIMLGDIKFDDLVKTPGIENIWVLSSGKPPMNPVEVLQSKELDTIIDTLKARFDVILFDSPPVLAVTDPSILAPKVDRVVVVYEIGSTSRDALIRTKLQLESVGAKIAGVILNNTRPQVEAIASYPYYSRKYRYYSISEEHDKGKPGKKRA